MIKAETEPLPEDQKTKLNAWLNRPEAEIFRKAIENLGKVSATKALEKAMKGRQFEAQLDSANATDLRAAMRYQSALEVLDEIKGNITKLQAVKLS